MNKFWANLRKIIFLKFYHSFLVELGYKFDEGSPNNIIEKEAPFFIFSMVLSIIDKAISYLAIFIINTFFWDDVCHIQGYFFIKKVEQSISLITNSDKIYNNLPSLINFEMFDLFHILSMWFVQSAYMNYSPRALPAHIIRLPRDP